MHAILNSMIESQVVSHAHQDVTHVFVQCLCAMYAPCPVVTSQPFPLSGPLSRIAGLVFK